MRSSPEWSVNRLNLWAKVEMPPLNSTTYDPNKTSGSQVRLDVVRFESHWAPNTIPRASIDIAVGRRADNLEYVSKIHTFIRTAKTLLKCQVFAYVREMANSRFTNKNIDAWPSSPFLAFDGYVDFSSRAVERGVSGEGAVIRLELVHWLADLAFSSALSRSSHPSNPEAFYMVAAFNEGGVGTAPRGNTNPFYELGNITNRHFQAIKSSKDLFGRCMLPFLLQLSMRDRLQHNQINSLRIQARQQNYEALRALRRFEPFDSDPDPDKNVNPKTYSFGVPLQFRPPSSDPVSPQVLAALATALPNMMQQPVKTQSIWDLMLAFSSVELGAAIVPMVDRALVVPAIPGYRSWWRTIYASEHDMMSVNKALIRPLRGVAVGHVAGSQTGNNAPVRGAMNANTVAQLQRQRFNIGGYYENTDAAGGFILAVDAPGFLRTISGTPYSLFPTNVPVSTAVNPALGDETPANDWAASLVENQTLLDRYAKMVYMTEVLKGRNMIINSRLRFDIAPGSTVRVYTMDDRFVASQTGSSAIQVEFGTVTNMSIVMDAERCQAGTSFQLGFVRNERETISRNWSTASHPLWKNGWAGAPLIGYLPEFRLPKTDGRIRGDDEPGGSPGKVLPRDPLGLAE